MHLEGQNIAIIGGGESGVGAAILANKMGANVFVSDAGLLKENYKSELLQLNVEYEESGHDLDRILQAHLVIKSPGIPNTAAVIQSCKVNRVDVVSEIEFAAKFTKAKKICITGSNGKTTTTMLVYHIFKNAGIEVSFAGNVGKSLARQVA